MVRCGRITDVLHFQHLNEFLRESNDKKFIGKICKLPTEIFMTKLSNLNANKSRNGSIANRFSYSNGFPVLINDCDEKYKINRNFFCKR